MLTHPTDVMLTASSADGEPYEKGLASKCLNCNEAIYSVLNRYENGHPVFLWAHYRDTIYRTQDCVFVDLTSLLLPDAVVRCTNCGSTTSDVGSCCSSQCSSPHC